MNIIIESSLQTLKKTQLVLDNISDEELCNSSLSPYYSSIGTHIRHILDFYDCIFNIDFENQIDLTDRPRNKDVESKCCSAENYLNLIIDKLNKFSFDVNDTVSVFDDLGLGKVEISYTIGGLLAQANSHTIHHYAIINYIFEGLNIKFANSDFGYNPSTPKKKELN